VAGGTVVRNVDAYIIVLVLFMCGWWHLSDMYS